MSGLQQGWLVAIREMRERSRSRAFRASVVVMLVVVAGLIIVPALLKPSGGTRHIGLTGSTPNELPRSIQDQGEAVGITTRRTATAALPPARRPSATGRVDVLVVDGQRLEWRRQADEQLRAVVTGAVQLVAVRERAASLRHQHRCPGGPARAGPGQERRARRGCGTPPW